MITFDQLRSALLDADPHAALDRLVRAELSAGRKTQAIHDELLGHLDAVRAMPEYTDELEDPLGDTLDALCGWVHPDYAYKDAPDPVATLPTEEEIAELPRWARVAFAARCARRVLPLYGFIESQYDLANGPPSELSRAVTDAIQLAETAAAEARSPEYSTVEQTMYWVQRASGGKPYDSSANPLRQIAFAADIAAHIAIYATGDTSESSANRVGAVVAAANSASKGHATPSISRDFKTILYLTNQEIWTDNTPVPPSVFGPMWPDGPPPGWPLLAHAAHANIAQEDQTLRATATATSSETEPLVDVYFAEGDFTADDMQLFLDYLAASYRELDGTGLRVVEGHTMVPEEAEVPQ